jgi:alkylation response protein AidB-like acyl-CoA dehydrogenase
MNFQNTEERRALQAMVERYLSEQYAFSIRRRICEGPEGFSSVKWRELAELGVIGALFKEADGGLGGGGFDIAVIFEALGRALAVEPFLASAILAGGAIGHAANARQRDLLPGIIEGRILATLAHVEPEGDDALTRVQARASRDAKGWLLRGHKAVVPVGDRAELLVVSARTEGEGDADLGVSLFLVPRDAPGVTALGYPKVDGGRAAEVFLEAVRVPEDALLGRAGQALPTLEHAIGRGVLALCAEALGAMEFCKQATMEYLRTRRQFGVPIGTFQALQHRMADLALEIEQARSAVINAAAALESERVARERALSAAKYSIGRIGTRVAEECIQMHGAIGMTWELPLSHYAKRLVMIDHELGNQDHHLARFIALGQSS